MMNLDDKKNYYEVLEVTTEATLQEIHNAYVRSKNAYSGDSAALYSLMSQDECSKILGQIEDAYSILGIADKRREYDKARGLNQIHTQEGFNEEIMNRPSYKPQNNLNDMVMDTTNSHDEIVQENAMREEFKYKQEHSQSAAASVSKVQAFKKFGLSYSPIEEFEQEIENCSEYTGAFLQKIREYKQVTVERMAEMTKISKTYIRNIEADEYTKLPAVVYTRGFVYQYAKCLKLNPDLVATSFIHHIKQLKNPGNDK
jgi:DnaJ-class molecular chaperone